MAFCFIYYWTDLGFKVGHFIERWEKLQQGKLHLRSLSVMQEHNPYIGQINMGDYCDDKDPYCHMVGNPVQALN